MITLISYVFGHNLAINGPLGSVLSAVEGMYSYRSSVVGSYIVMMIALAFNVMSMNLIIMDTPAGTATSIVVGWCIHYSYTRSVCVYHRFKTSHREENFLREEIEKDLPKPRGGWNMIDRQRMATKRLIKAFRGRNMHKKSIRAESFDGKNCFDIA